MILSTVPVMTAVGCSGVRVVSRFTSAIFADLAMRGFAISFKMLARAASSGSFLALLCNMCSSWHRDGSNAVPFRTVAKCGADSYRQHHVCVM